MGARSAAVTPASTTSQSPTTRPARTGDAAVIAAIHNQGIEDRVATFETEPRRPAGVAERIQAGELMLVAERHGEVLGFASVSPYSTREVYAGVGEASVYVERGARGGGVGAALVESMAEAAKARGLHKLVGRLFTDNEASVALFRRHGFNEVGVHRRHSRLDGAWRDVLLVERLLGAAADD
jgi:L-amino acid N-acyltransferase YncA